MEADGTPIGKASKLLYYIVKRQESDKLRVFVGAMREHYPHLVDLLEGGKYVVV